MLEAHLALRAPEHSKVTACTAWQGLRSAPTAETLLHQLAASLVAYVKYTRYLEELAASSNLQSGGMLLVF